MIEARLQVQGEVASRQELVGKLGYSTKVISPNLKDLVVTPSNEEQNYSGEFGSVKVLRVNGESIEVTPSEQEQTFEGIYTKVTVGGDTNLVPENIRKGVKIFGIIGTYESNLFPRTNLYPSNDLFPN